MGDIVRICERDIIPADGIILSSSEDDGALTELLESVRTRALRSVSLALTNANTHALGTCFIDTSNLDGEANLKFRESLRATLDFAFTPADREKAKYFVKCEQPDQDLYRFSGNLSVDSKMFSLSEKQFLLRGSTLMNTKWIHLLVVYTGTL